MKIGILALQGAFSEHEQQLQRLGVATAQVRLPQHLADLDGLIIPGGESTTIGKLATDYGLVEPLRDFARQRPTWGTCAGLIFLAQDIGVAAQPILGLMAIHVNRNAFGRQVDSFETPLTIADVAEDVPFPAVFIRAPLITGVEAGVRVLATLPDGGIVAVRQGHWLATAFHPELTDDLRLHRYFCGMVNA
ncbi:MAG: pyridoxal 5'-phosphate synthase glutaminase subunit PdxT [Anaerolineae bacterium]|jgi:5'-phosphate synthase pdxT subunit|nr:pyridoxal 5'-phosphate synthase glutaminase subunit PdxT [Anaerolineae bacterium]